VPWESRGNGNGHGIIQACSYSRIAPGPFPFTWDSRGTSGKEKFPFPGIERNGTVKLFLAVQTSNCVCLADTVSSDIEKKLKMRLFTTKVDYIRERKTRQSIHRSFWCLFVAVLRQMPDFLASLHVIIIIIIIIIINEFLVRLLHE